MHINLERKKIIIKTFSSVSVKVINFDLFNPASRRVSYSNVYKDLKQIIVFLLKINPHKATQFKMGVFSFKTFTNLY